MSGTTLRLIHGGHCACWPAGHPAPRDLDPALQPSPRWGRRDLLEPHLKIYRIESGHGWYATEGGRIDLAPGNIYLLPGGQRHSYGCTGVLVKRWFHVAIHRLDLTARLRTHSQPMALPTAAWNWWDPVWTAMPEHFRSPDPQTALRLEALTLCLIAHACPQATDDPAESRLAAAIRLLEESPLPPPVDVLARASGLSVSHFHRLFRTRYGGTPQRWALTRRLDRAAEMLARTQTAVQAIAVECGWEDPGQFSRLFRAHAGESPREFRRRMAAQRSC